MINCVCCRFRLNVTGDVVVFSQQLVSSLVRKFLSKNMKSGPNVVLHVPIVTSWEVIWNENEERSDSNNDVDNHEHVPDSGNINALHTNTHTHTI